MIKPKKSLGQNFLTDPRIARRIVDAVSPVTSDLIIEIGPGTGALTHILAGRCDQVIAVEIDRRLVAQLAASSLPRSVSIVEGDALELDWEEFIGSALRPSEKYRGDSKRRVRIVGNLPYYISTPIIERLIEGRRKIFDMTLMLQNEVVERIVASPGIKAYGYLSILVQYHCFTAKLFKVPPEAFEPAPRVWSAVVRLTPRERPAVIVADEDRFFGLVRAAFAQRRKTIANNLKAWTRSLGLAQTIEEALAEAAIDPKRRAETLSIQEFADLNRALNKRR